MTVRKSLKIYNARFLKGLSVGMLKFPKTVHWDVLVRRAASLVRIVQGCEGLSWLLEGALRKSKSNFRRRRYTEVNQSPSREDRMLPVFLCTP